MQSVSYSNTVIASTSSSTISCQSMGNELCRCWSNQDDTTSTSEELDTEDIALEEKVKTVS